MVPIPLESQAKPPLSSLTVLGLKKKPANKTIDPLPAALKAITKLVSKKATVKQSAEKP